MKITAKQFHLNFIKRISTAFFLLGIVFYALIKGQTAMNILLLGIYIISIAEMFNITFNHKNVVILSAILYFLSGIAYISYAIFSLFSITILVNKKLFIVSIDHFYSHLPYITIYILIFCPIFIFDIVAYFVGSTVGGPKLLPKISPKKTWAGIIGGCVGAFILMATVANVKFGFYAILLGLVGQVGDLLESHYKRKFGVKDSGNLLPGHGGILDRMDSVFSVSIFVYTLYKVSNMSV